MGTRLRTSYARVIEWVPVGRCKIEPSAQRPYNIHRARALAAELDPDKLGFPFVGQRENGASSEYLVIDGQHRIGAVRIAFGAEQKIQCEVTRDITTTRAADLFVGRNTASAPRPLEKFLASLTAKHTIPVEIDATVRALGLAIAPGGRAGTVQCVSALQAIYRMQERETVPDDLLRRTLTLLHDAWGKQPEAYNGDVVRGVALFVARHWETLDSAALRKKLTAHSGGPLHLIGKARSYRDAEGGPLSAAIARVLVGIYNGGRRTSKLPAWSEKAG